jgi:Domain of unknown function (DUF4430)
MTHGRNPVVAIGSIAVLAAAGCGLGPGADVGSVSLTVTRDYGATQVVERSTEDVKESDTVMRVLDRNAAITTRYGGGFVQSIDGTEGHHLGGRLLDWFFYVNGIESSVGAADVSLHDGERIWWDYRDWTAAMHVPAVVGSFPEPFAHGYEGKRRSTEVACETAAATCARVRAALRRAGADLVGVGRGGIRVLVGPWRALRHDSTAARIESGPQSSGVFADFVPTAAGPPRLFPLGEDGKPRSALGPDAGLVAATRRYDEPPVWIVTGTTGAGVRAAAGLLDPADLRDDYAVAIENGEETPLPLR